MATGVRTLAEVTKTYVLSVCELCLWDKDAAAQALGVNVNTLRSRLYAWRIKNRKARARSAPRRAPQVVRRSRSERRAARNQRVEEMAALYRDGLTLLEIGEKYAVSRQRVQQLLATVGVGYKDGGRYARGVRKRAGLLAAREQACISKNGMGLAEYTAARKTLGASGASASKAFWEQRRNMRRFGYEWTLTFAEWWNVWQLSGQWDRRGRGADACWLVRKNNTGAYSDGNVEVARAADFVSFVRETERVSGRGIGSARSHVEPLAVS